MFRCRYRDEFCNQCLRPSPRVKVPRQSDHTNSIIYRAIGLNFSECSYKGGRSTLFTGFECGYSVLRKIVAPPKACNQTWRKKVKFYVVWLLVYQEKWNLTSYFQACVWSTSTPCTMYVIYIYTVQKPTHWPQFERRRGYACQNLLGTKANLIQIFTQWFRLWLSEIANSLCLAALNFSSSLCLW